MCGPVTTAPLNVWGSTITKVRKNCQSQATETEVSDAAIAAKSLAFYCGTVSLDPRSTSRVIAMPQRHLSPPNVLPLAGQVMVSSELPSCGAIGVM